MNSEQTKKQIGAKKMTRVYSRNNTHIPIVFQLLGALAASAHPSHIAYLCSWGFAHLPPTQKSKSNGYTFEKKQNGIVLIVCLVLLLIVTLIGVAGLENSTMEMKMVSSGQDRSKAFEAAEAALIIAENELGQNTPSLAELHEDCIVGVGCTCPAGTGCYNASCEGGLCFDGAFPSGVTKFFCEPADNANTVQRIEYWSDSTLDVWNNNNRHKTVEISLINKPVKYIIEFLCFVAKDDLSNPGTVLDFSPANPTNGVPLFRITVLAEGNGDRSKVMLQSTYKATAGH